jgi:hypothetical protein
MENGFFGQSEINWIKINILTRNNYLYAFLTHHFQISHYLEQWLFRKKINSEGLYDKFSRASEKTLHGPLWRIALPYILNY